MNACPNLAAVMEEEVTPLPPPPPTRAVARPAIKRVRASEAVPSTLQESSSTEEGSTPIVSEESCPPTTENKKKWNGKKERGVASVIAQVKDSTFLRFTDTLNLNDVWFLPLSVARCGSLMNLNVTYTLIIDGVSIVMHDFTCKTSAEDLLKMIHLCVKMRNAVHGIATDSYEVWKEKEMRKFATGSDVVRGDSSDAAFAEYKFASLQNGFSLGDTPLTCVFRKSNQHVYIDDCSHLGADVAPVLYGNYENPNKELCTASRGAYSYCLEVRIMWLDRRAEIEELEESQRF